MEQPGNAIAWPPDAREIAAGTAALPKRKRMTATRRSFGFTEFLRFLANSARLFQLSSGADAF